jgi:hypothetical protein
LARECKNYFWPPQNINHDGTKGTKKKFKSSMRNEQERTEIRRKQNSEPLMNADGADGTVAHKKWQLHPASLFLILITTMSGL